MVFDLGIGKMSLAALSKLLSDEKSENEATPLRIVTHSAEIENGDLFCALRGEKDGHLFAKEAAERGALAILAEEETEAKLPHILVKNVIESLGVWANHVCRTAKIHRIAITGSVGKTSTKNAVATVLGVRFRVHAARENYNNLLGVPLTVLETPPQTEILVAELGTNQRGEIAKLSAILEPHTAIITRIGQAHIGAFGSRGAIADEKLSVMEHLSPQGKLFLPPNEPLLDASLAHGGRTEVPPLPSLQGKKLDIAAATSLGYAYAVGKSFGLTEEELSEGLQRAASTDLRRKKIWAGNVCLIDDTYNASPESMQVALEYLSEFAPKRKIAVLGDMLELGNECKRLHEEAGKTAACSADVCFFFGENAEHYMNGAHAGECHRLPVGAPMDTARALLPFLQKGDTVLFKASHGVHAERVCNALRKLLEQAR